MVEFRKMTHHRKAAESGKSRKSDDRTVGLNLRQLSIRRHDKRREGPKEGSKESKNVVENRKILYARATEYLSLVFSFIKEDKLFSLEPGFSILEKIVDSRTPIDALFLKAIHDEDSYDLMVSHSVNVAIYAIKMAENLGFSKYRQVEIGMVGLLHDIGMAKIPEELIYKQSLTDDEFLIFKERPKYGYDILSSFKQEYAYLAECALQIHERVDGTGYPRGLHADEIHEYSQIIGLVDIYEALIHSRPQREKILHFYAVKEIIKTGKTKFQQRYLKALLNTFSIFPLNSYIRLNSGAIGRVIRTYPDQPMRPKIQIVYDSQSKRVLTERLINLPDHSLLYILDSVSEQELVEISEASYLVTKPGQGIRILDGETGDSGETEEDDGSDDKKTDVKPQKEQSGKPKSTFLKKALLAVAGLFLIAAAVWQFLADTPGNGISPVKEKAAVQFPGKEETATSEISQLPSRPPEKPPGKMEMVAPERLATEKVRNSVPSAPQDVSQVEVMETGAKEIAADEMNTVAESGTVQQKLQVEGNPQVDTRSDALRTPEQGRYPYSILLASYKQLQTAQKSFAVYKKKGLDPFWVKVDLGDSGIWFRVFSGNYADKKLAEAVIEELNLEGSLAKPTRYADWIGGFADQQKLDEKIAELSALGFSPYVMAADTDIKQLYVGAFYTQKGAEDQHVSLKHAGVESRVVKR